MAPQLTYPEDFERLWSVYPNWPKGRSKKKPSYEAFLKAKKMLGFTPADLADIEAIILERVRYCETWQKGNKFGPEMFATFFNQHRWNEPYPRIRGAAERENPTTGLVLSDEENQRRFWQAEHIAGRDVPSQYQHYIPHH